MFYGGNRMVLFYLVATFFALIVLYQSGKLIVAEALSISSITKVSKIIIGSSIISLATSLPEFIEITNQTIDINNKIPIQFVLNSLILHLGLSLSLVAFLIPGKVDDIIVTRKTIMLVFTLITLTYFTFNYEMVWYEGAFQFVLVFVYVYLNRKEIRIQKVKSKLERKKMMSHIGLLLMGALGLYLGARLFIMSMMYLTHHLWIIIIGCMLPELMVVINALMKKERHLAFGNIIGSSILNLTMILGYAGIIAQGSLVVELKHLWLFEKKVPKSLWIDLPFVFLFVFLFMIPIILTKKIKKWQGLVGLIIFIIYISYLLINIMLKFP